MKKQHAGPTSRRRQKTHPREKRRLRGGTRPLQAAAGILLKEVLILQQYDLIIIGGGITGCAVARELSRYRLRVAVLEAMPEIGAGTTKANGGLVHSGYDPKPGTLKALLNLKGCLMYPMLSRDLGFRFHKTGSMVIGFNEDDLAYLEKLYRQGLENGVPNLELIRGKRIFELEPQTSPDAKYALYSPHTGMVDPFEVAIAFSENAAANGVEFHLSSPVSAIREEDNGFVVTIPEGELHATYLVDAAGVHADDVARLAGADEFNIIARHGDLLVLDKHCGVQNLMTLYPIPSKETKGVVVMNSVSGNTLVGSSAEIKEKDDNASYQEGIQQLIAGAVKLAPNLNPRKIIRTFAGCRAVVENNHNDFYIRPSKKVPNLFYVAGIQSPGVASSPAIAAYVAQMLRGYGVPLEEKEHYVAERKAPVDFSELSPTEKDRLIQKNPAYGKLVCSCECVTEGEIVDAIHRVPGARTIDGIKRRTRAGMGRCQGGFCQHKVLFILARELHCRPEDILMEGKGSQIVFSKLKEGR
jgi:glycerol-3-phosphate dehydrogenase